MRIAVFVLATATLAWAAPSSAAQLVTNGDFSASAFGTAPAGYSGGGYDILTGGGSAFTACCGYTGTPAQIANQFAVLGAFDRPNTSTLAQVIATNAGTGYTLTFDYGAGGNPQLSQTLLARVVDVTTGTVVGQLSGLTASPPASSNLGDLFKSYSLSFTALGQSRLEFSVNTASASVDAVLDNVSVLSSDVPEPAGWATMVVGFGLIGAARRRGGSLARWSGEPLPSSRT